MPNRKRCMFPEDELKMTEDAWELAFYDIGDGYDRAWSKIYLAKDGQYWIAELDGCSCVDDSDIIVSGPFPDSATAIANCQSDRREKLTELINAL